MELFNESKEKEMNKFLSIIFWHLVLPLLSAAVVFGILELMFLFITWGNMNAVSHLICRSLACISFCVFGVMLLAER